MPFSYTCTTSNNIAQGNNQKVILSNRITLLKERANFLLEELTLNMPSNPRRPSLQYKNIKKELLTIEKEIKRIQKDIKKFTAIKNTAIKIGKKHGNIILHGVRFSW